MQNNAPPNAADRQPVQTYPASGFWVSLLALILVGAFVYLV